ncbi:MULTISPECIES: SIS domain-containing protein [Dictyoglomus]|uniref:Sugar isomerase (SIS) n=1 Tax=Dictyoglomus turgidum (strain DSM 6724 / Z-1310) TaxID=515635 RepID=B8DZ57_DICTD|nr:MULTISPECIES: SIS domain-containing protein [Dictyoglomus]ACK41683.1 sugar isomerase (SIS) [Dictyoglomus turgidum DSM 6724]PNV80109.1 MAG: iron dicitrate transport regulator FecR [Dictyoglomus turgidum]HBU31824.1 SIS domain-containing protein [Dictyoglomus sp.]
MYIVEKEIKEQITDLPRVFDYVKNYLKSNNLPEFILNSDIIYFIGCGTSLYLSLSGSRFFTFKTNMETKALPGGEIWFSPKENIGDFKNLRRSAILISRSGESTEVVKAGEKFKEYGIPTLGITLEEESSLVKISQNSIVLPIKEDAIVMTKSFSSMLLTIEMIASFVKGEDLSIYKDLLNEIEKIINTANELSSNYTHYNHYIFLGLGAEEGIARESALKLEEMSLSKIEAYSTFEYRHGPKSLLEKGFLVSIYTKGIQAEEPLIDELKSYGAEVITIGGKGSDFYISDLPESLFLKVIWGQILGLNIAKSKNINVESPRNLSKVVKF